MAIHAPDTIAVIFVAQRIADHDHSYGDLHVAEITRSYDWRRD